MNRELLLPLLAALAFDLCAVAATANAAASKDGNEQAYRDAVAAIESNGGAYDPGLAETLLGLGTELQSQGRHADAVRLLKRGAHLARINDGLYGSQQIPLLQGEIASHIALKNYHEADERQDYLLRVQRRTLKSGDVLVAAYMEQAQWQYQAYSLDLDKLPYLRLMAMWDLYLTALNDLIAREGSRSPKLLPALHGMLRSQYLISSYPWQAHQMALEDDVRARQGFLIFSGYHDQSFQKGSAVIAAIRDIEEARNLDQNLAVSETSIMLGDWRLWNAQAEAAAEAYRQAETELARRSDAQIQIERYLGEPTALPAIAGLSPLPTEVAVDEAEVLVEFGVTERGRVVNIERLDENADQDAAASRLLRTLRKTKFRPRLVAGQLVETDNLVKAFALR